MALMLKILCFLALSHYGVSSTTIIDFESDDKFVEVGSILAGSCSVALTDEVKLRLSDEPCSYTADSDQRQYLTSLPTLRDSGFEVDDQQTPITFRLENTTLKQYNIRCGEDDVCGNRVSYSISITEEHQTLSCLLRFTKNEVGSAYLSPTSVTWLKNSHQIGETVDIEKSDFTEENETLSYTAQYQLIDTKTEEGSSEKTQDHGGSSDPKPIGGVYTCQYSLNSQQLSADYEVTADLLVKISIEPREDQYSDGDDVVILCNVTGHPTPNVTWLFNGQPLEDSMLEKVVTENVVTGILSKINLTNIDDKVERGEYTCTAQNEFSTVSEMKRLHVRDSLAPLWPFIGIVVQVVVLVVAILIGERIRKKKLAAKFRHRAETMKSGPSAE